MALMKNNHGPWSRKQLRKMKHIVEVLSVGEWFESSVTTWHTILLKYMKIKEFDPDTQIHWRHDTPGAAPRDNMVFHDTQNAKTGVPVVDSGIGGGGVCGTLYFSFEAAARSTGRNWWF